VEALSKASRASRQAPHENPLSYTVMIGALPPTNLKNRYVVNSVRHMNR
jgi:hypothetical protein